MSFFKALFTQRTPSFNLEEIKQKFKVGGKITVDEIRYEIARIKETPQGISFVVNALGTNIEDELSLKEVLKYNPNGSVGGKNQEDTSTPQEELIQFAKLVKVLKDNPEKEPQIRAMIAHALDFGFNYREKINVDDMARFAKKFPTYSSLWPSINDLIESLTKENKKREYRETAHLLYQGLFGEEYLTKGMGKKPAAVTKGDWPEFQPHTKQEDDAAPVGQGIIDEALEEPRTLH